MLTMHVDGMRLCCILFQLYQIASLKIGVQLLMRYYLSNEHLR